MPLSFLAIVDAGLGRSEQALEEATRACELSSFKKNNIDAVTARYGLAVVYAWTGHNDLAIAELNKLVDRPSGGNEGAILPSYGDFRRSPLWDPLRNDPAFEALVQRLAPPHLNQYRASAETRHNAPDPGCLYPGCQGGQQKNLKFSEMRRSRFLK